MKCTLKAITPLHVGNGKEYGPADYYQSKTKKGQLLLARADISRLFSSLSEEEKDEFIEHLSDPSFQLEDYLKNILGRTPPKIRSYLCLLLSPRPSSVQEHIKTMNKAYIPGSSIKGSIRTAILHGLLRSEDIDKVYDLIPPGRNRKFWPAQDFHNQFFAGYKNDPKYSIMKFLQISDTGTVPNTSIFSSVSLKVGQGSNEWYSRNGRTVISYLETIGVGRKLEFDINSHYNSRVHGSLGLEDKKELLDVDNLKKYLFEFSQDYIDHEINFAQKYQVAYLEKFYLQLEKLNEKDSPLMRIGFGSGFLSTTIGLRLKNERKRAFEMIMQTFKRSCLFEFPKTRKLTLRNQKPYKPLGWVKVIFDE